MTEFLLDYGLFLLKAITFVACFVVIFGMIASSRSRPPTEHRGNLQVHKINDRFDDYRDTLRHAVLSQSARKAAQKAEKQRKKSEKKADKKQATRNADDPNRRRRVYVLDFDGDIKASAVDSLREAISGVLQIAEERDEVVVRLESAGGMVHSYGLAASELARIRQSGVPLTVCVDKVAASGGYMMACVAERIIAAPFAILGSIGVVAQIPNFHKVLKKHDIDYELITAGEHKRTLTLFGENTDQGREKFREDIQDTHDLFKDFVRENRPAVSVEEVATGEVWFGSRALDKQLIDEIKTSDEYLMSLCPDADVFEVHYVERKGLQERLGITLQTAFERAFLRLIEADRIKRLLG
ncbi:MAG: protease SohB [Pseudomonadota bacterium]